MKLLLISYGFILLHYVYSRNESVYICGASGAKKYHYSETCRGLSNCKHEVVKKTLKEAQSLGLTICGWED
jgi:hypothetical protein